MTDKLSLSLDDLIKDARASKTAAKKEPVGGKATKERGGREQPYSKKDKKDQREKTQEGKTERPPKEKVPKERKERPPAEPSTLVFVGGLPFTIEASVCRGEGSTARPEDSPNLLLTRSHPTLEQAIEAHLSAVAPCSVDLKMRKRGGESKPAGFAIATFESIEPATEAIEKLHESELGGRKIAVRFASPE